MTKRIVWQMQANVEGGLPERVRQRALAIAKDANLHKRPLMALTVKLKTAPDQATAVDSVRDSQLPPAGDVIQNKRKAQSLIVKVNENDFELNGNTYATLSAFANAVSGLHVSGFIFLKPNDTNEVSK